MSFTRIGLGNVEVYYESFLGKLEKAFASYCPTQEELFQFVGDCLGDDAYGLRLAECTVPHIIEVGRYSKAYS